MTIRNMDDIKWRSLLFLLAFVLVPLRSFTDEKDEADTLENHGMALYQQELYDEAVRAFRQLLEIRPNQQVYFNIGQCEFMRQRFDLALEAFTVYLSGDREKIAKKRLEYTEKVVDKITPLVGTLDIRGESPLEVWIDDELRGNTPLSSPLYVLEGEHRFAFKKDGEIVQTETYAVKPDETITIQAPDVAVEPKPTPEPVQEGPVAAEPVTPETPVSTTAAPATAKKNPTAYPSPLKPIGVATLGLGGVVMVTGVITGSVALSKINQLDKNCPDKVNCSESDKQLEDSASLLGTTTDALLISGGVLAATGVVLTVLGHRQNKNTEEKLSFTPVLRNNEAAGLMISGRF